jgi:hypothetical protein
MPKLINPAPHKTRVYQLDEARAQALSKSLMRRKEYFCRWLGRYGYEEQNVTTPKATYRLIRKQRNDKRYTLEVTRGTN